MVSSTGLIEVGGSAKISLRLGTDIAQCRLVSIFIASRTRPKTLERVRLTLSAKHEGSQRGREVLCSVSECSSTVIVGRKSSPKTISALTGS